MSSTMYKKNSKGQIIEELDPPLEKVEPNPLPFLKVEKVEDKEILDWCERYLAAKKNNLYTLYDLYKFYKS